MWHIHQRLQERAYPNSGSLVVIDFDRWGADLIRGRHWHDSQEITEWPGGSLRLRLRLDSIEEAEGFVLGWGTHATVVRPQDLARRVQTTAGELAKRHSDILEEPWHPTRHTNRC